MMKSEPVKATLARNLFLSVLCTILFSGVITTEASTSRGEGSILDLIMPVIISAQNPYGGYLLVETLQGSIKKGEMDGGRLDESGWTNVNGTDMLKWDLGKGIESGIIEFDVKGLSPDTQGGISSGIGKERGYYFGLYNQSQGDKGMCYDKSASLEIRLNLGIAYSKAIKLQAGTATIPSGNHLSCVPMYDMDEPFGSRNRGDWDPSHIYRHKIVFGSGEVELFIDDVSEVTAKYADKILGWRYLFLGRNNYKNSTWPGPKDLTFSNLKVRDTSSSSPVSTDYDYGDLPDPGFATLSGNNGARHILDGITYMGAFVDAENNGQSSADAEGDDTDGSDDEDGVAVDTPLYGGVVNISVTVSVNGYMNVWADLDNSGSFDHSDEYVLKDKAVVAGKTILPFVVPEVIEAKSIFLRFRFSSGSGQATSPGGDAPNGEVEDYLLQILP